MAELATEGMDAVNMQFKHLLSKVKFTFTNGLSENEHTTMAITDVKMIVPAKGTVDLAVKNPFVWNVSENETITLEFGKAVDKADDTNTQLAFNGVAEVENERLTIPLATTTSVISSYEVSFNVTIYQGCKIGNRCILHAGCVIGADGFGFAPAEGGYSKIPQIGIVELEDDVEIGANACVDRATMGRTLIHHGVKLDNMVQIGHNVEVGNDTVMSAQCGVAGSAKVGSWSMFGGQCGIAGHIQLGDRLNVGAQSGIPGPEKGDQTLMGYPAIEHRKFARSAVIYKKLPEMYSQLGMLQREIESLKKRLEENK